MCGYTIHVYTAYAGVHTEGGHPGIFPPEFTKITCIMTKLNRDMHDSLLTYSIKSNLTGP